jgi:CDP-diacylglycerol--glycerol-3-phosphate 3-phosphatidyltransferase
MAWVDQRSPRRRRLASEIDRPPSAGGLRRKDGASVGHVTTSEAIVAVKQGYTDGTRRLASRYITRLARTRVTPNALTAAGVALCLAAAAAIPFESRNEFFFYWLGAGLFIVGSILDILDGALARQSERATPLGEFLDSISDRVSEGFVLAAIALVFARAGDDVAVVFCVAAVAGSFLVSYARAKAELIGLRGDVGLGSRAERVVVISAGLILAPLGVPLQWFIYLLAATAWLTVVQRILSVRKQLQRKEADGFDQR